MDSHVVLHGLRFEGGDLISPAYAAEVAGVGTSRLARAGIPSVRDGRGRRKYRVADVLAWCVKRDARNAEVAAAASARFAARAAAQ